MNTGVEMLYRSGEREPKAIRIREGGRTSLLQGTVLGAAIPGTTIFTTPCWFILSLDVRWQHLEVPPAFVLNPFFSAKPIYSVDPDDAAPPRSHALLALRVRHYTRRTADAL